MAVRTKQWIDDRLEFLASKFAIAIGGFAVLDNHLHLLIRHDPEIADQWSASEVIRRWMAVYPPSTIDLGNAKSVEKWIAGQAADVKKVETFRDRPKKMLTSRQLRRSFFAADPSRVREHSARTGTRRANLSPQPVAIG